MNYSPIWVSKNYLNRKVQGLKFNTVYTIDTLNFLNLYTMSKVCQLTGKRPIVGIYEYLQRLEREGVNTGVSLEQGC